MWAALEAEVRGILDTSDFAGAERTSREALARAEAVYGPESVEVADLLPLRVLVLKRCGYATRPGYDQLELARRGLAINRARRGPDHLMTATSLLGVADMLWRHGEFAAAKPLGEQALAIRERAFGPDDARVAEAVQFLAKNELETGDYTAARRSHERALAIVTRALGPEHPDVGGYILLYARCFYFTGDFARYKKLVEQAIAIRTKAYGPKYSPSGEEERNLGNAFHATGDYQSARLHYERAVAVWEGRPGGEHHMLGVALNSLAETLTELGDPPGSRKALERAVEVLEVSVNPQHLHLARALAGLAGHQVESGDLEEARTTYERALTIFEKRLGPVARYVAQCLAGLANVAAAGGDYREARGLYERALTVQERALGRNHPRLGDIMQGLARVLQAMGNPTAALAAAGDARSLYERALGPDHPATAAAMDLTGSVHLGSADYDQALPLLERALAIREESLGIDHALVAETLGRLARARWGRGESGIAVEISLRSEAMLRRHLSRVARSLSEREALRQESVMTSGLDLALTALVTASSPRRSRLVSRAWDETIRSRSLVLGEMAERHRSVLGVGSEEISKLASVLESARGRFARLAVRGPDEKNPAAYRQDVRQARIEMERAERALAAKSAAFRSERESGRAGLAEVLDALPARSALVAYVQYERLPAPGRSAGAGHRPAPPPTSSYLAFVACNLGHGSPAVVSLGSAANIDALVQRWRREVAAPPGDITALARYVEAGDELRRAVWDPVARHLADRRRVFVVPDGELHLVNFGALPAAAGRYLIETGPEIDYLTAERDLVRGHTKRDGRGGLLVVGGADFDAHPDALAAVSATVQSLARGAPPDAQGGVIYRGPTARCTNFRSLRFGPIPSSLAEADDVESLWRFGGELGGVVKLTAHHAGESAFKRLAAGRRVIHLATHGFQVEECAPGAGQTPGGAGTAGPAPENPLLLSGLALAGANTRAELPSGGTVEDGVLTAEEIASLDLREAEWVVLSACSSGVGPVRRGEGVLGLRRAFQVAGAGNLLMSLWPVADHIAREWMHRLYEGRSRGLSTAQAVRSSSVQVLQERQRSGVSTHPFYWGAFVAAGEPD